MEIQPTNPQSSHGPVIGVVIVIIVLLVGAFYFLGQLAPLSPVDIVPNEETATGTEMTPTSSSDEIDAIEADLEAEDFEDIDAELNSF